MKKYICDTCGYVYDPEVGDPDNGIAPGTAFEAIPEDWVCPLCGVGKDDSSVEESRKRLINRGIARMDLWTENAPCRGKSGTRYFG